jgi:hypothetical protein
VKYYEYHNNNYASARKQKSAIVGTKAQAHSFWHKEGVRTPDADQASQLRPGSK